MNLINWLERNVPSKSSKHGPDHGSSGWYNLACELCVKRKKWLRSRLRSKIVLNIWFQYNLIMGLAWVKNSANLGISSLCSSSIFAISRAYSWQMKWRTSKAFSASNFSFEFNILHTLGTISGQLANFSILNVIVLMRENAVSLMTGDGSSKAERHSLFREATNLAGKRWKWVFMLASRMQPLWTRVFSSINKNRKVWW